ncbi:Crp/Fnr family transcriptional regulator [Wenxinia saemankumensis]|uniref:cAMP-binding domain of CRP or a regulatory subunit of cAMP-dependent protein kinases n=1 Tax=Wenxinia saemankumensis TaxID=1447782 RepID=A0A1M6ERD1_9RHOB|nr:Crp/Fnr family transcriptional regulator [Wenxinia saemankumensis]SHI88064.1 cAMP-binding domain of CRP or a regulatory subunit of cAMP-dependent protein kinases [Wenxinia saemankumensis]
MSVICEACPLRDKPVFTEMSDSEARFMREFKSGEMRVSPGSVVLMQGSASPQLYTVLSGMGLRHQTLENGRKQVINFLLPGDFLGLQASLMGESSHTVEAVTEMVLCCFQRNRLEKLIAQHPSRAYDLIWVSATDEHFLGETIATLGQRTAQERVAWGLVRLYQRLEAVDLAGDGRAAMPIRQQDLADALGLSLVHTNKTLANLRQRQVVTWRDGQLLIHDLPELARIGLTDLEPLPRRPLI